jgi:hypothetical protein
VTASEWKGHAARAAAAEAVELTLPSGMTIKARRPSPLQVAMWGHLPLGLAAAAAPGSGALSSEDVRAGIELSRRLLEYCCVDPRVSLAPQGEHEIHPSDIPLTDTLFILRWARGEEDAEQLRTFRGGADDGGPGGDGGAVRTAAERAAGNRGADAGAGVRPGGGGGARVGEAGAGEAVNHQWL